MGKYIFIISLIFTYISMHSSFADQVFLKNGDRITGKIVKLEDGNLTIKGELFDKLVINTENIETFKTDEPVELHLGENPSIMKKVDSSKAGKVEIKSEDENTANTYHINEITRIGPLPDPVKWTRQLSVAVAGSEGNSENFNFNFGTFIKRRSPGDRITFQGEYYFEKDGDETTQDEWYGDLKYDYFFTEKFYGFSSLRMEMDELSNLDYRLIFSPGAGYQWIESDDMNFSTEAGLAYLHESFSDGESNNEVTLRLAYLFDKVLYKRVNFFHGLQLFPAIYDPSDLYLTTSAGLRTQITENFFTEAKVTLEHDTTPADGAEETDINYSLGIGVNF